MTTSYSTFNKKEAEVEIKANKEAARKIASSKKRTRAFLISAGIICKDGTLAPKYR